MIITLNWFSLAWHVLAFALAFTINPWWLALLAIQFKEKSRG